MNMYERIEFLRRKEGISQGNLEKELGFSNGSISKWKTSTPKPERLQVLADHFGVSIDFLMGKTDMVVCPICGFGDNPLSDLSRKEHAEFHKKFLDVKRRYPFFMTFSEANIERTDRISEFRNPQKTINGKIEAFEKYLEADFSLKIHQNNLNIESLDYKSFCQTEVCDLEPDYAISQDVIDALVEKYEVDKNFSNKNERLLARASNNSQLMRLLAYAEKLNPEMLNMLEIQAKALSEQNKKEE